MALKTTIILLTTIAVAASSTAFDSAAGKNDSEFDTIWKTTIRQDEFDGMPLPENTDVVVVPSVTQATPAVIKNEYYYSVPYTGSLGKKKNKPGKKNDILEQIMGVSFMSGGTLFSLGTLALVTMASKALLVAFGAIILIFLSSGWMPHLRHMQSGSASTVYEVIAKPQVSHSYLSEVHHEPYSAQPSPPPSSTKEYAYYGHR